MVRTDEYEARFQAIISAWLPPEDDMHGETVLLIDGNKRYIRKDGLVCVTIVKAKDGTSAIDADFRLEQALLDEVSKAPVVSRQPSKESTGLRLGRRESVDSMAITVVNDDTKALIASSVSENTLRNYRYWSKEIEAWLGGRSLDDGLLAEYITGLHAQGKSPATISQAVAAVRWQARNNGVEIVGEVTTRTLAGIRREGKDRGRGQVEGLTWADVERVCAFAEMDELGGWAEGFGTDPSHERLPAACLGSGRGRCRGFEGQDADCQIVQDGPGGRWRNSLCHKRYAKDYQSLSCQSGYRGRCAVPSRCAGRSCPGG